MNTECKDCKFREGDCGHHHRIDGEVYCDIPSLSCCDKYGNCGHFQQKETPKGDLISREALKKKLQENHDFFVNAWGGFKNLPPNDKARVDEITNCISEVVNAPTVEERPQGEWIPVSERLPEYSGLYLISVDELVTVANFTGTYFMHRGGFVEVDAWMPLIEPYKKDGGKEE